MSKRELVYEDIEIGEDLGTEELVIERDELERYLDAVGSKHVWYSGDSPWGQPIVPTTLFDEEVIRMLDRKYSRFGTLHTQLEWEFKSPAFVGERVKIHVFISDKRIWQDKEWFERTMEVTGEDGREIGFAKHGSVLHLKRGTVG